MKARLLLFAPVYLALVLAWFIYAPQPLTAADLLKGGGCPCEGTVGKYCSTIGLENGWNCSGMEAVEKCQWGGGDYCWAWGLADCYGPDPDCRHIEHYQCGYR